MSDDQKPEHGFKHIGDGLDKLTATLFGQPEVSPSDTGAKGKPPRPRNAKLAQAAADIIARPPDKNKGEILYTTRELVQCNFPIRDPGNVPSWTRRNGNLTLIIQPGIDPDTGESLGIPRGEWPRLMMRFFQKQCVLKKQSGDDSQVIKLGSTQNDFLRATGGNPNTGRGPRGDARRIEIELRRLIYSHITFRYKEGTAKQGREAFHNMNVAKSGQFWWDYKNPEQGSFFQSEIVLGDLLYQAFINDPIPVDFRALLALKRSLKQASFAMDLHEWGQGHLWNLRQRGEVEQRIRWKYLPEQFGAEYARLRDWKASFEENLYHAEQVTPALGHEFQGEFLIIKDLQGRSGLLPPTRRRMQQFANNITPKSREWFLTTYPLHTRDFGEIETAFNEWREKEGIVSQSPDKHFQSFVRYNWFNEPKKPQG
jgi:hypothetical protein